MNIIWGKRGSRGAVPSIPEAQGLLEALKPWTRRQGAAGFPQSLVR